VFRVYSGQAGTNPFSLDGTAILSAVRAELGLAAGANPDVLSIHSGHVYAVAAGTSASYNRLDVIINDIEESGAASTPPSIARFQDDATPSGVAHVGFVFPVSNRPTFSRYQTFAFPFITVTTNGNDTHLVTVDMDITFVRTSLQ